MKKTTLTPIAFAVGLLLVQPAQTATLDLTFNYRLTPTDAGTVTIATAHFEDVITSNGLPGISLRLTNVASNSLPGQGSTSYISGLLLAFDYKDADLPGILVDQGFSDTAHSDRWEPQEDVATVDGFTFTSELGFPRAETPGTVGWRLGVGEYADVQFLNDNAEGAVPSGVLPQALTVATLKEAIRGSVVNASIPKIIAAVKVRSAPNLTGGEVIESVPTIVVGAAVPVINKAPIANAGADVSGKTNEVITIDGTASSDPDGNTLASYEWTQTGGAPVVLSNANQVKASFTAPATVGQLAFSLKVSDGQLQSTADTVLVNITRTNAAPRVDAGNDKVVTENTPVSLTGLVSDPDGDLVTYQWQQTSGNTVTLTNTNTLDLSFTAPSTNGGVAQNLEFSLTTTDNFNPPLSTTDTIKVQVNPAAVVIINQPPFANAGSDINARSTATVQLIGSGSDPENNPITSYEWQQLEGPAVVLNNANSANPSFIAPSAAAKLVFALKVSDGSLQGGADTVTVTVQPTNVAPSVNAGSDQSVNEVALVTLQGSATDADGDGISYQWQQIGGKSVQLKDADKAIATFTAPSIAKDTETLEFQLTATDNFTSALSASDSVKVHVNNDGSLMDCSQAKADKPSLWPANASLVNVKILGITSPKLTGKNQVYDLQINSVTQDEPLKNLALKDKTSPDAKITKTKRTTKKPLAKDVLYLRAERQGTQPKKQAFTGNGRVYQVNFTANDGTQSCNGLVNVQVPAVKAGVVVDDGQMTNALLK